MDDPDAIAGLKAEKQTSLRFDFDLEDIIAGNTPDGEIGRQLKAIVEDIGAHMGIVVSDRGFQKGAVTASVKTSLLLLRTEDLEVAARRTALQQLRLRYALVASR